jgi:DNA helicase II / ATP-dependent DNA helicase PcrA
MPDDRQADESFRRVINTPTRGFGAKAMTSLEQEAARRSVAPLQALDTASRPPKTCTGGLTFADVIRNVARMAAPTAADSLSLVLDATGYRKMLRENQEETMEGRLDNVQELSQLAGAFRSPRELPDYAALSTVGPSKTPPIRSS